MYFVYILACVRTGRSYVGQTGNLIQRYRMHRAGTTRYSREKILQPVVIHWESLPTRAEAVRRERYYKAGSGHRTKSWIVANGLKFFR